jgi:hypothetical protein
MGLRFCAWIVPARRISARIPSQNGVGGRAHAERQHHAKRASARPRRLGIQMASRVRTAGANTAEWLSDRSSILGTKMQPYAQSAHCAGTSTWRTLAAKGNPSLSHSWPITTLSVSFHRAVDGKRTPHSWGIEDTCASRSFHVGVATLCLTFEQARSSSGCGPYLWPAPRALRSAT